MEIVEQCHYQYQDFLRNYPDAGYIYSGDENDWIPLVITGHIDNLLDKATITPGISSDNQPSIYCNWKNLSGFVVIRCLPGHQKEAKEAIARYHDPDHTDGDFNEAMSLYDYMDQSNSIWNSIGFIAWTVAIIAFIITLLGVYSAISIDTTRRRKEMAVRKTKQDNQLIINTLCFPNVAAMPQKPKTTSNCAVPLRAT